MTDMTLTLTEIEALRVKHDAGTYTEWYSIDAGLDRGYTPSGVVRINGDDAEVFDLELAVDAVNALPALLAMAERCTQAEADRDVLRAQAARYTETERRRRVLVRYIGELERRLLAENYSIHSLRAPNSVEIHKALRGVKPCP